MNELNHTGIPSWTRWPNTGFMGYGLQQCWRACWPQGQRPLWYLLKSVRRWRPQLWVKLKAGPRAIAPDSPRESGELLLTAPETQHSVFKQESTGAGRPHLTRINTQLQKTSATKAKSADSASVWLTELRNHFSSQDKPLRTHESHYRTLDLMMESGNALQWWRIWPWNSKTVLDSIGSVPRWGHCQCNEQSTEL